MVVTFFFSNKRHRFYCLIYFQRVIETCNKDCYNKYNLPYIFIPSSFYVEEREGKWIFQIVKSHIRFFIIDFLQGCTLTSLRYKYSQDLWVVYALETGSLIYKVIEFDVISLHKEEILLYTVF